MLDFSKLSDGAYAVFFMFLSVWLVSFASIIASFHSLLKIESRTNQVVILLSLNLSELIFAVTIPLRLIPYFVAECLVCEHISKVETWNGFCYYGSFFLITIDRFLCLLLNIKYNVIVTPRRIKIAASIMIGCCFVCSLPFYFLPAEQTQFAVNSVIYPTLDSLFVITATSVYITIMVKLHTNRISDNLSSRPRRSFDWPAFRRRYKVPMLIIITFVCFIQIPDLYIMLSVYLRTSEDEYPEKSFVTTLIIYSCWFVGFLCDSIIYIRLVSKRQRRTNTILFSA